MCSTQPTGSAEPPRTDILLFSTHRLLRMNMFDKLYRNRAGTASVHSYMVFIYLNVREYLRKVWLHLLNTHRCSICSPTADNIPSTAPP